MTPIQKTRNICSRYLRGVLFCLSLLALAIPAIAQDAGFGSISGTVTDPNHAVVAGATVTVIQIDTGIKRELQTTSAGSYAATFLKPGHYELIFAATGFAKVDRKDLVVQVGQVVTIDAELPVATAQDTVTITGETPLIDTQKIGASQEIGADVLSNVPINGRRFDNVVLLTPNVVPDGASGLLSFRGISGLYNTNLIDGANNNQAFFSEARGRAIGAPYVYSTDSIQEFQSGASSYSASFGQAAGGQINAITRSGSNQFHGDVGLYLRNPELNALDPWSKQQSPLQATPALQQAFLTKLIKEQYQYGGSVGGPIIRDKLFFFFTYDGFRKSAPILVRFNLQFQQSLRRRQSVQRVPGEHVPFSSDGCAMPDSSHLPSGRSHGNGWVCVARELPTRHLAKHLLPQGGLAGHAKAPPHRRV